MFTVSLYLTVSIWFRQNGMVRRFEMFGRFGRVRPNAPWSPDLSLPHYSNTVKIMMQDLTVSLSYQKHEIMKIRLRKRCKEQSSFYFYFLEDAISIKNEWINKTKLLNKKIFSSFCPRQRQHRCVYSWSLQKRGHMCRSQRRVQMLLFKRFHGTSLWSGWKRRNNFRRHDNAHSCCHRRTGYEMYVV